YSITGEVSDKKVLDMNGMTLPPIGFIDQSYIENENTAPTASNGNYSFKGTFEGNGFNICNLTIAGSFSSGGKDYFPKNIGFFGDIAKHTCESTEVKEKDQVSNFTLSDVTINTHTGKANAAQNEKVNYVGYACGYVDEGKLSKVGVYNCRINCTSSYFRSNYTLIGEKNVSNSSLAESAPILDYAFDPHNLTNSTIWNNNETNLYKDSKGVYNKLSFSSTGVQIINSGESLNDKMYLYKNNEYISYSSIVKDSTKYNLISELLYDPRVFDAYGDMKTYMVGSGNGLDTSTNTFVLDKTKFVEGASLYETDFVKGAATDYFGNPITIKLAANTKYNCLSFDKNSVGNVRKMSFTCNGSGKFLVIFVPNNSAAGVPFTVFKKQSDGSFKSFVNISLPQFKQSSAIAFEFPIVLSETETSATFTMGITNTTLCRFIYLRFMMQSEFGNTGGSGSVESVDYTYSTLEIPGSTGFTLSRITIRFDSPDSKDVIIVVTREKSDTSDEIKISSDSKYVIGSTNTNFTIINKVPAGSNITINYPPSS
ncbi:MAG: hypothetical protein PUB23_01715, partial [Bacilli bacterium]|nr:hypothetical protein [Bacilli bacterium]